MSLVSPTSEGGKAGGDVDSLPPRDAFNPSTFELVIEPGASASRYWRDLWNYRELFFFLAWRDVTVRYKQTVIGVAWALLQPLVTMVVFTVIFGKLAKMPTEGVAPYAIMVFAGLLPWQFFAAAMGGCSNSLINNANLLRKIYFPRIVIPASAVVVSFVDLLVAFAILVGLMAFYQFLPSTAIFTLPLFIALAAVTAFSAGLWLASLNVKYRDFRIVTPFIVQFGFFVSPVGFSSSVVPEQWRLLYSLNPMVGVIDGFRWAILGGNSAFYWPGFFLSLFVTGFLLITGLMYFRRTERSFADVI